MLTTEDEAVYHISIPVKNSSDLERVAGNAGATAYLGIDISDLRLPIKLEAAHIWPPI